nr:AlpA family phage regulatory protein [Brevundimonas sp.]
MDDRLLPWGRVQEIAGISRATAWRMQKTGDFPEPVPVSPNRVGWWESELTAWKATRKASGRARPSPFVRPREPRLIETARSSKPVSGAAKSPAASVAPVQGALPLDVPSRKPRRRTGRVSPDQIDFGF